MAIFLSLVVLPSPRKPSKGHLDQTREALGLCLTGGATATGPVHVISAPRGSAQCQVYAQLNGLNLKCDVQTSYKQASGC